MGRKATDAAGQALKTTKTWAAARSVVPECGTKDSAYKQHDWRVWDAHFRRCGQCGRTEAVGISAQAMTPVKRTYGRGHQHEWASHPWWSDAAVDTQTCYCGEARVRKRKLEKAGSAA